MNTIQMLWKALVVVVVTAVMLSVGFIGFILASFLQLFVVALAMVGMLVVTIVHALKR
jgi:hypothetical protein